MPERILVIDDDQDTCDLLRTYFRGAGYEVETCLDGSSALAGFRKSPCDVVITDIRMPDMDGIEVLRALKAIDPDTGVIIFSAAQEDRTRVAIQALRGGAADYFVKPLGDFSQLERAVANAMAVRSSRHEIARRMRELELEARTDPLTGLANRLELEQRLREEFSRLGRGVEEFALAVFDVDSFKRINDEHGHLVGDEVLTAVAGALRGECRAHDVKARYGGDEFVVVMPYTRLAQGVAVAEKIRRAVAGLPLSADGIPLHVTLSAGVTSTRPREGITPEGLIRRADRALYEAKNSGRNQIVPVGPGEPAADILVVEGDAAEAEVLVRLCNALGYRAEWAATGADAIERARGSRYVLALVDSRLPDLEGTETISRIKEISPTTTAALVTGAEPESSQVIDALSRFPVILARKPVSIDHLRTLISDARRRI